MSIWFSPFPLEAEVQNRLERCGWSAWPRNPLDLPAEAILIYPTPDQLLVGMVEPASNLDQLIAGYQQLLTLSERHRLLSAWRLEACSDDQLQEQHVGTQAQPLGWPCPDPLTALITKHMVDTTPLLLNIYLDLELKAELLGGEPDTRYRKRLIANLQTTDLLQNWHQLSGITSKLADNQSQFAAAQAELQQLRQQKASLDEQIKSLQAKLSTAQEQLADAREEAELTLEQLHLVQEELERYFLLSESLEMQRHRYEKLLQRSEQELSSFAA